LSDLYYEDRRHSYFSGVQVGDIVSRKEEPPDHLYLVTNENIEETVYDGPIRYLTLYSLENGTTSHCLDGEVNVLSGTDGRTISTHSYENIRRESK